MSKKAKYWINKLNLQEHPEGGYFAQTYKSEKLVRLPEYDGLRHAYTAIYYLTLILKLHALILKGDIVFIWSVALS